MIKMRFLDTIGTIIGMLWCVAIIAISLIKGD